MSFREAILAARAHETELAWPTVLLTPAFVVQNDHPIHHLWPRVPFFATPA